MPSAPEVIRCKALYSLCSARRLSTSAISRAHYVALTFTEAVDRDIDVWERNHVRSIMYIDHLVLLTPSRSVEMKAMQRNHEKCRKPRHLAQVIAKSCTKGSQRSAAQREPGTLPTVLFSCRFCGRDACEFDHAFLEAPRHERHHERTLQCTFARCSPRWHTRSRSDRGNTPGASTPWISLAIPPPGSEPIAHGMHRSQSISITLMVVHPALIRPLTPAADSADLMTAPQKGFTASDQSAVLMSCEAGGGGTHQTHGCRARWRCPTARRADSQGALLRLAECALCQQCRMQHRRRGGQRACMPCSLINRS